eukprot:symbB.v1.2.037882.t1/scaffold5496.1/size26437/2
MPAPKVRSTGGPEMPTGATSSPKVVKLPQLQPSAEYSTLRLAKLQPSAKLKTWDTRLAGRAGWPPAKPLPPAEGDRKSGRTRGGRGRRRWLPKAEYEAKKPEEQAQMCLGAWPSSQWKGKGEGKGKKGFSKGKGYLKTDF